MTKVKAVSLLVTTLPLALALACGGSPPEPAAATPAPPEPSAVGAATSPPATAEPAPTASAPPSGETPPAAATGAEPPAAAPASIGETKDECTPVGVDFEKRARPKLKECYAEGKKKSPTLEGTVKIKITVDVKGKIKSTKVIEKTLPDPVADCMLKAIKATPFPEVEKCWDSTLTIPVTFPTPK
ncbi:MAG: AgmX/PglI C-terminal domain-containing protein [Labilithrix sp.]|nr:AgmX/PglI C-terminal domain-containing protein [Labilithrix sp.]